MARMTDNARMDKARQVAGVDNARTFGIDHSDKFRSHFASVLVYCYLKPVSVYDIQSQLIKKDNVFIDKVIR